MVDEKVREPKQKRSIEKKQNILKAASDIFYEKGYEKTSIAEIAKKAGVSVGIVYSYFKDKKNIFLMVLKNLEDYFLNYFQNFFEGINKIDDMDFFIREIIDLLIKSHIEQSNLQKDMDVLRKIDKDIELYCNTVEEHVIEKFVEIFNQKGIVIENVYEKVSIIYFLVENVCHRKVLGCSTKIDLDILKEETISIIINIIIA